jgi:hypothetical protein
LPDIFGIGKNKDLELATIDDIADSKHLISIIYNVL